MESWAASYWLASSSFCPRPPDRLTFPAYCDYQNIVKEGEIAGGRATGVDTSNGFSGETPAGSEPTAAAAVEEIRSLREALQAAEQVINIGTVRGWGNRF